MDSTTAARIKQIQKFSAMLANSQPVTAKMVKAIHAHGNVNLFFVLEGFGYTEQMKTKSYKKSGQTTLDQFKALTKKVMALEGVKGLKAVQKEAKELLGVAKKEE